MKEISWRSLLKNKEEIIRGEKDKRRVGNRSDSYKNSI